MLNVALLKFPSRVTFVINVHGEFICRSATGSTCPSIREVKFKCWRVWMFNQSGSKGKWNNRLNGFIETTCFVFFPLSSCVRVLCMIIILSILHDFIADIRCVPLPGRIHGSCDYLHDVKYHETFAGRKRMDTHDLFLSCRRGDLTRVRWDKPQSLVSKFPSAEVSTLNRKLKCFFFSAAWSGRWLSDRRSTWTSEIDGTARLCTMPACAATASWSGTCWKSVLAVKQIRSTASVVFTVLSTTKFVTCWKTTKLSRRPRSGVMFTRNFCAGVSFFLFTPTLFLRR